MSYFLFFYSKTLLLFLIPFQLNLLNTDLEISKTLQKSTVGIMRKTFVKTKSLFKLYLNV